MRIEEIYLREIGPFAEARVEFPPGSDPDRADVYLLTGPNGCGKSTVLYALAGALTWGNSSLGQDLGAQRLRSTHGRVRIRGNEMALAEYWRAETGDVRRGHFHAADLDKGEKERLRALVNGPNAQAFYQYALHANAFQVATAQAEPTKFSWAAFAYAGLRSVGEVHVSSIQEPKTSPFSHSLSFVHTADASQFAQWVASQEFKRLKAQEAGRKDRAEALRGSITHVERVVSAIIGEPFSFVMAVEDNNVRAQIGSRGQVLDLGLLPDGLKSIVSWVADLLMRLDRIPWVDDTPPQNREFLLLLDEVDIHLHPAWQRKILPIVQQMFPKAQIIASTHSPFVVASAVDARIISLGLADGVAFVQANNPAEAGASYGAILRSVFGLASEFDVDTEQKFQQFYELKQEVLAGNGEAAAKLEVLSQVLADRSEELRELVVLERRQMQGRVVAKGVSDRAGVVRNMM